MNGRGKGIHGLLFVFLCVVDGPFTRCKAFFGRLKILDLLWVGGKGGFTKRERTQNRTHHAYVRVEPS